MNGPDPAAPGTALAAALLPYLPARPRLLLVGAGHGAMLRRIAAEIARPQVWVLIDDQAELVQRAFHHLAEWAAATGLTVTWPGRAMLVHTSNGVWRIEGEVADLAMPAELPLQDADAVLCDGLLDNVPRAWLQMLAAALPVPFLAGGLASGHDQIMPRSALDGVIARMAQRTQRRAALFDAALGDGALHAARQIFHEAGFQTCSTTTTWALRRDQLTAQRQWIADQASAALAAAPAQRQMIAAWQTARLRQALAGRLQIARRHQDFLAVPQD